ncbi:MAG: peptidoglycan recognition protein [Actinomycetota bacterium]|nr:peptidoglycan recognition protein [Actinomycetota bacterium]
MPATAMGGISLTEREVPLHGGRALVAATPRFDMVGLHWRGPGAVQFRTRSLEGRWSAWRRADPEAEDLPNVGSPETRAALGWRLGNPYWTGSSDRIEYRLHGRVERLRAYFVHSPEVRIPLRRVSMADSPPLLGREAWGANEAIRRAPPRYATSVQFALVHHTAGSNSYTPSQSAAIVRGIEVYHVKGNGWNDIGYNFLVDKFGQVFEGRYGGVDKNVIGAHAEGFNTGSTGVAVLGTYGSTAPSAAARTALSNLLAWRLDVAHVDPQSTLKWVSGGNARFASGVPVMLRAVSGHRDTGLTTCPGTAFYAQLDAIARQTASVGLPKLYTPSVRGGIGGQVRFQARLSESLPWTVTVTDSTGKAVASGTGESQDIDWTWDAATAPQGSYAWTIAAGDTVRPASGTIGAKPVALAITSATALPRTITPNGDGQTDSTQISYTLTAPATVTATLRGPDGRDLSVLFSQARLPGKQSFRFAAAGVADGRYEIVLNATDGRATVTSSVSVLVDRTVRRFAAAPLAVSPNGDGVGDELTFGFELTRVAAVKLEIAQAGKTLSSVYAADLLPGMQTVSWNASGLKDGKYAGLLTATNDLGTVAHTAPFRIDTVAPDLRVLSFRGLRFRVSEPATIRLTLNGKLVTRSVRAGVFSFRAQRIRTVRVVAQDAAGNVSRTLKYR